MIVRHKSCYIIQQKSGGTAENFVPFRIVILEGFFIVKKNGGYYYENTTKSK